MASLKKHLLAVAAELQWFVRAQEVRLLHIVASPDLRDVILKVVMGSSAYPGKVHSFVRLRAAESIDEGWPTRIEELRFAYGECVKIAHANGVEIHPPNDPTQLEPAPRFAALLAQYSALGDAETGGPVMVMAPESVRMAKPFADGMMALLANPELRAVRWIVIDPSPGVLQPIVQAMGDAAVSHTCVSNIEDLAGDLERQASALETLPAEAPAAALMGAAWPRVIPPKRIDAPPPADVELNTRILAERGIRYVPPEVERSLTALLLRLALAEKSQKWREAIALAQQARDLSMQVGRVREAVVLQMTLAALFVSADQHAAAIEAFVAAAAVASAAGHRDLEAQAHMGRGACLPLVKKPHDAIRAYAEAASIARAGNSIPLAIAALHIAGELSATQGMEQAAVTAWKNALDLAAQVEPETAMKTSAPASARCLANVSRRRKLLPEARALEAQADRLARGPNPVALRTRIEERERAAAAAAATAGAPVPTAAELTQLAEEQQRPAMAAHAKEAALAVTSIVGGDTGAIEPALRAEQDEITDMLERAPAANAPVGPPDAATFTRADQTIASIIAEAERELARAAAAKPPPVEYPRDEDDESERTVTHERKD